MLSKLTLKAFLDYVISRHGEYSAMTLIGDVPITYEQVGEKVKHLSAILKNNGIQKGDRVAILSENRPNWVITYFAVTTMGAVAVPILPDFQPDQVRHILRHSACKALFISERQYDKIQQEEPVSVDNVFLMETLSKINPKTSQDGIREMLKERSKDFTRLKNAALKMAGKGDAEIEEDDLACIIYTSGTTGHSKGVMLSHKNLVSNTIISTGIFAIQPTDQTLSILPLSHTYECTVGMLVVFYGGGVINYFDKPPSPRLLLDAMAKIRPTVMLSVPLVIEKIFKNRILPQFQKSKLMRALYQNPVMRKQLHKIAGKKLYKSFGGRMRFFGIGGAKLATDVEIFLKDSGFPYAIGYGLTETSPLLAGAAPDVTRIGSTGPAGPGVSLRIASQDPYRIEGELQAKGPNIMLGYFKDPELTKQVFTPDGWFKTGDLAIFDKDDFVYIKGRSKNVIIGPSGENIYPEEVETLINQCEYVLESLVFNDRGKLAARVHLNYDAIDTDFACESELEMKKNIQELLKKIRNAVNEKVTAFSRLNKLIEQTEPFEKTPTQKIKRFLYTS